MKKTNINGEIRSDNVRLIDNDGNMVGEVPYMDALNRAYQEGLDLVEVGNNDGVSICKVMDYGKHLYEKNKKEKKNKKNTITVKEVQIRPVTEEHDLKVKAKQIDKFLNKGNHVRIVVKYRGRELSNKDSGINTFGELVSMLTTGVIYIQEPKMNGHNYTAVIMKE